MVSIAAAFALYVFDILGWLAFVVAHSFRSTFDLIAKFPRVLLCKLSLQSRDGRARVGCAVAFGGLDGWDLLQRELVSVRVTRRQNRDWEGREPERERLAPFPPPLSSALPATQACHPCDSI